MNIEDLVNSRYGEKIIEHNKKMLPERLTYRDVHDTLKGSVILLVGGLLIVTLLFILSLQSIAIVSLVILLFGSIIWYLNKSRKCGFCGLKMNRFMNDNRVLFCCDTCRTKFECIIGIGD